MRRLTILHIVRHSSIGPKMNMFGRSDESREMVDDQVGRECRYLMFAAPMSGTKPIDLTLGSWAFRLTLTLAVGLTALRCSPEPSIEQTSAWLTERLPQFARVGDRPGSFIPDHRAYRRLHDVAITGCLLSFTEAVYDRMGDVMGAGPNTWSYNSFQRYQIDLTTVDLKEIAVVSPSPSNHWQIRLVAFPGSVLGESSHRSTGFGSQSASTDWLSIPTDEVYITVDSEENAERVSSALHNLARQCGAKASPF